MSKRASTDTASIPIFDLDELKRIQKKISDAPTDKQKIALEMHAHEMARKRAELDDFINDTGARKLYAGLIFILLVFWLGAILWIVIATGSGWYKLSDTVLITLITSTTINITGFFLIVTQYLFPKKA